MDSKDQSILSAVRRTSNSEERVNEAKQRLDAFFQILSVLPLILLFFNTEVYAIYCIMYQTNKYLFFRCFSLAFCIPFLLFLLFHELRAISNPNFNITCVFIPYDNHTHLHTYGTHFSRYSACTDNNNWLPYKYKFIVQQKTHTHRNKQKKKICEHKNRSKNGSFWEDCVLRMCRISKFFSLFLTKQKQTSFS